MDAPTAAAFSGSTLYSTGVSVPTPASISDSIWCLRFLSSIMSGVSSPTDVTEDDIPLGVIKPSPGVFMPASSTSWSISCPG
ncbi:hypothetical protein BpHYR1_009096 [Brachionus plicatilis]|uniref:Uncharacterized protein n=1 Tax=Brachionus plicatilis TaxID=10195 RepID=A0A3M7QNT0_BRAPC|nr:hypothetical protein BpHYR1_009096 [Brachionus plicatilis]